MNQFLTEDLEKAGKNELPGSMQTAQGVIDNDEIRDILIRLSKYNLGICMPHMHGGSGNFIEQPSGIIAVENRTDFVSCDEWRSDGGAVPVVWRWKEGKIEVVGSCWILRTKCDK